MTERDERALREALRAGPDEPVDLGQVRRRAAERRRNSRMAAGSRSPWCWWPGSSESPS